MPTDLIAVFLYKRVALGQGKIRVNHLTHQCVEGNLRLPPQFVANLTRVTEEGVDLRGPEIARVHPHEGAPGLAIETHLFLGVATPCYIHTQKLTRQSDEVAHGMLLARGHHVILGLGLLQHQPLRTYVVARMTPVPSRVEITEMQRVLEADVNACQGSGNFA